VVAVPSPLGMMLDSTRRYPLPWGSYVIAEVRLRWPVPGSTTVLLGSPSTGFGSLVVHEDDSDASAAMDNDQLLSTARMKPMAPAATSIHGIGTPSRPPRSDEEKMLARVMREIPKLTAAVVGADVHGDPSYDATQTGAADAVRDAGQGATTTARAIAARAELVLADEPAASLDPSLAREIVDLLIADARERGAALVCTLHQPELARSFDRVITLEAGRIVRDAVAGAA